MKTLRRMNITNARGFSLTEILVVIAIMGTVMAISAGPIKHWLDRAQIESELRTMHANMLQARARSMQKNSLNSIQITADNYIITEDTNNDGIADSTQLTALPWQVTVITSKITSNPPVSVAPPFVVNIDQRGLISFPSSTNANSVSIQFNTGGASTEYDCFELYPTRVNLGKWNTGGATCDPR